MRNFKFATLAILELLAFNVKKIKGHVSVTTPPFRAFFSGVMSGLYLGSCMPNFKFAPLAILELLAFNARDRDHAGTYKMRNAKMRKCELGGV